MMQGVVPVLTSHMPSSRMAIECMYFFPGDPLLIRSAVKKQQNPCVSSIPFRFPEYLNYLLSFS